MQSRELIFFGRDLSVKKILTVNDVVPIKDIIAPQKTVFSILKTDELVIGDLLVLKEGERVVYFGVIQDLSTEKTTEVFAYPLINITNTDCFMSSFNGSVANWIETVFDANFVNISDLKLKLPFVYEDHTSGEILAFETEDGNLFDALYSIFLKSGIYTDFELVYDNGEPVEIKVNIRIANSAKEIRYDNPLLAEKPKIELSQAQSTNKIIFTPSPDNVTHTGKYAYYLLEDNTVTNDATNEDRLDGVVQEIKEYNDEEFSSLEDMAEEALIGDAYSHKITLKIKKNVSFDYQLYQKAKFIGESRTFETYVTRIESIGNEAIVVVLGVLRNSLSDRIKEIEKKEGGGSGSSGGGGSPYVLPKATSTTLGGIIASEKTTETNEVKIDPATGKLYASGVDSFTMDNVIDGETYVKTENNLSDTLKSNYDTAYTNTHTHSNKTILDNTTASYTTTEQTKLSAISGTNTGDQTSANFTLSGLSEKDFSSLTGKPTTISGYGITDAYNETEINTLLARKAVQPYIARKYSGGNGIRLIGIYNYSASVGDTRPLFYLAGKQGHGNGTSYLWQGEFIFGVSTTGVVTAKSILKVSDGTYGKFYYRHDTVNKILYIYVYTGQYSSAYFSDLIQINAGNYSSYFTLASAGSVTSDTVTEGVNILYPASGGTMALSSQLSTITLNGSVTQTPNAYAPTSAGNSGQILLSNGSGTAPTFQDSQILPPNTRSFWDGSSTAIPLLQNDGLANSVENPYLIDNAKKLAYLSANPSWGNGKYFKQTVDIDLDNYPWTPINSNGDSYNYYYDGNSCSLYHMNITTTITDSSMYYIGLFGLLYGYSYINSLSIKNSKIIVNYSGGGGGGRVYIGAFAGYVSRGAACNLYSDTTISASVYSSRIYCGGLFGYFSLALQDFYVYSLKNDGSIDCESINNVLGYCGGIIGYLYNSSVLRGIGGLLNTGKVCFRLVGGINTSSVGGVFGRIGDNTYIEVLDCLNIGPVIHPTTSIVNTLGEKAKTDASNITASSYITKLGIATYTTETFIADLYISDDANPGTSFGAVTFTFVGMESRNPTNDNYYWTGTLYAVRSASGARWNDVATCSLLNLRDAAGNARYWRSGGTLNHTESFGDNNESGILYWHPNFTAKGGTGGSGVGSRNAYYRALYPVDDWALNETSYITVFNVMISGG